MPTRQLLLSKPVLLILFIVGSLMIVTGALFEVLHYPTAQESMLLGGLLNFIAWLVVCLDILRNEIRNKYLWLLGIIIFGVIACLVYISKRDKLIEGSV